MCRTVAEITEQNIVVQQLDTLIEKNGDNDGTLVHRVLRLNLISHEQNKDDRVEIMAHIKVAKKNPSLVYLLRNKTIATLGVLATIYLLGNILFRMIEYFVPIQELVKGILP